MQGTLAIGTLKLAGLTMSELMLQAQAHDGLLQLTPIRGRLYGGSYDGELTLDARGALPVLTVQQRLMGIQMAPLLHDFAGTARLSGSGTLSAMLTGRGADSAALLHALDGQVVLDVGHGALLGIDLPYQVARAQALLQHATAPTSANSDQTSFRTLHASATVHNGIAETHDLDMATQLLTVRGQATLDLSNDVVNSKLQVALLKAPASAGASGATLAEIPLTVTGTLASVQVRPDLSQLARSQLQQQLQQQLQRHGVKLPAQVQGALKGLFGGAHAR
jgi:AsmA protein